MTEKSFGSTVIYVGMFQRTVKNPKNKDDIFRQTDESKKRGMTYSHRQAI